MRGFGRGVVVCLKAFLARRRIQRARAPPSAPVRIRPVLPARLEYLGGGG